MSFLSLTILFVAVICLVVHDIKSDHITACMGKLHLLPSSSLQLLGFKYLSFKPKTRFTSNYIYQFDKYVFIVCVTEIFNINMYSKTYINLIEDPLRNRNKGMKYSVMQYGNRKNLFNLYKALIKGFDITDQKDIYMKSFHDDLENCYKRFNLVRGFMNK